RYMSNPWNFLNRSGKSQQSSEKEKESQSMSLPSTGSNSLNGGTTSLGYLQSYQNALASQQNSLGGGYIGLGQSFYPGTIIPVTSGGWTTTATVGSAIGIDYSTPRGVDKEKLAKLKQAEPRKVLAKVLDLTEPIVGYRCWMTQGKRLRALGAGEIYWEPKKADQAKCI